MTAKGLNPKREALAVALAKGASVVTAARLVGICERHAHRLRRDPAVKERVRELQEQVVEQGIAIACQGTADAAARLRSLVYSDNLQIALNAATRLFQIVLQ